MCRGTYQVRPPLPFTPGAELCGEVVQAGPEVTGFAPGDRVIGGRAAARRRSPSTPSWTPRSVCPRPAALDDAEAAPFHMTYQTGWFGLHRRARLQAGETLLVHAAAGGVGSGAVQLGKAAGARVIGVVGGPEKAARGQGTRLRTWSSTATARTSWRSSRRSPAGAAPTSSTTPVGGDAFRRSTKCIAFEGRIVIVGFASGDIPSAALNHALVKNYSILGLHWGLYARLDPAAVRTCHAELTRLADAGAIRTAGQRAADPFRRPRRAPPAGRRRHHRQTRLHPVPPAVSAKIYGDSRLPHGGQTTRPPRRARREHPADQHDRRSAADHRGPDQPRRAAIGRRGQQSRRPGDHQPPQGQEEVGGGPGSRRHQPAS